MQKTLIFIFAIVSIFYITSQPSHCFIAGGGQYSFGISSGPSTASLGDALISLPEDSSLMKFSAPSTNLANDTVQGYFSTTNMKNTVIEGKEITVIHTFLEVGYIKNTPFYIDELYEITGISPDNQETSYTLLNLEDSENSHILIMNDHRAQTTTFLGIVPGKRGVLLLSTNLDESNGFHNNLSFFNNLMESIEFKTNKKYSDFKEDDIVYTNNIPYFLKDFNLLETQSSSLADTFDNQSLNFFENTNKKEIKSDTDAKNKESTDKNLNSSTQNNTNNSNANTSTFPTWVIPLGLTFFILGTAKKIIKEIKNEKKKKHAD